MPSFLTVVLPLALLVSLMFTLGKLHRANELTAMRAAGVGFGRLLAPVWLVGVLACALSWWLNANVVPWSVEESRSLKDGLEFRRQARTLPPDRVGAVNSVGFDNPAARRMWFFNRYSKGAQRGYGVSVSELDIQRRELVRLVAAQAWYDTTRRGWMFKDGRELIFDVETGEITASVPFAEKYVEKYREDPQLMLLIDRRPIDLSLEAHLDEYVDPELQLLGVEQTHVALDDAALFECAYARETGRGRQMHALRQFDVGEFGVALQFGEDLAVGGVQSRWQHFIPPGLFFKA
jgi:lipopolysaccharide export system permease protein